MSGQEAGGAAEAQEAPRAYAVVGAGAIGGTLAAYLAQGGAEVTVIDADEEHVHAIREHGLKIERADGPFTVEVQAFTPSEYSGSLDRVVLAVKAQATVAAMQFIAPLLDDNGWVVSVQNGLNEPVIASSIGVDRTVAAFVNIFADLIDPGVVLDGGVGALVFGEYQGGESERIKELVADLRLWGGSPVISDNVEGFLWSKLSFGAMLAATSVADVDMHELISNHRPTMHGVAQEVLSVAEAQGISPEPFDAYNPLPYLAGRTEAERDAATDKLVTWLGGQTKKRSGIWRDIAVRKRPTEIPSHFGPVVEKAQELGIAVPLLTAMLASLAEVEGGAEMSEDRLFELDRIAPAARADG